VVLLGQFFFANTVTADHYLFFLQEEFLPFLQGMGVSFGETFFQQVRARPHTVNAVLDVLNENFDGSVV
jgi:hypothetical protein